MARPDGRPNYAVRPIKITRNFIEFAEGSVLVEFGRTKVICTASVEDAVPKWMENSGAGWVTAEYGMLPKCSKSRIPREKSASSGRTSEIQRLIGRSLRAVTDLTRLKGRTVWIDCDVIQADGGTRTAAITGSCVALHDALTFLKECELIEAWPLRELVAGVSVGVVGGIPVLDLNYEEDATAEVDMNLVMTEGGRLVEIQGTAEGEPFTEEALATMMELGRGGIRTLTRHQRTALGLGEK